MALSIGELVGYLTLDDTRFQQGLDSNKRDMERHAGAMSKIGHGIGKALKLGVGVGLAGVGLLFGTALTKGFTRLVAIDQAKAKLAGLGHSGKQVDKIMSNALASVKGTAFGLDEAATVSASAVAAGIKPGHELTKTLKLVADAATIGGTSMGEMGAIFNKVATSNKVQGDVINQLNDKGIPIVQMLGKSMHKTSAQVMEMSKKGQIGFADFSKAMQQGVGGAALKSGSTFTGAWKNMIASLGRIGAGLMGGIFPHLAPALSSITKAMAPLEGMSAKIGDKIGHILAPAFERAGPAIQHFTRWLGRIDFGDLETKAKGVGHSIAEFFRNMRGSSSSDSSSNLHQISTSLGEVKGSLKGIDFSQLSHAFGKSAADSVSVFGVVIGFLAKHLDTLAKIMPAVLVGYAALKVAQTAEKVLGIVNLPIRAANTAALFVSASANRQLAIAMGEANGTERVGMLTRAKSTVVTIAQTVASKTAMVATKAWTVAQRALNLVLRMNPIGLVITALVLLGAGLVLAYKKSETFRKIVNAAWSAVKAAASAVVGWFTHSFVPFFTRTIPNAFHSTVSWVKHNWPVILAIITGPIGLATLYISRHWDTITGAFAAARRWVTGTFSAGWHKLTDVIVNPIRTARDKIGDIFGPGGPIRGAFSKAVEGIKTIWDKLKGYAMSPVRFIVNTVYNNGIRKVVNAIPSIPGTLGIVKGFRTGGPTGSGRDDQAVGVVHGNEHVVTADEVRRTPGGHATWERLRAAALSRQLPGYKGGGSVWPTTGHRVSTYPGHDGVDINGAGQDYGNPIYAWRSGKITYAGWNRGYGHAIFEQAPGYPSVVYGHGSAVYVHGGQNVRAGQMIGRVGSTGHSTGPHLHFGHPGGTSALAYALLRGAGSAGQQAGGGGGSMVSAYSGPSLASVLKYLKPSTWTSKLKGMGGWGPMLAGTVGNMASSVKGLATEKIHAAIKAAGQVISGIGKGYSNLGSGSVRQQVRAMANVRGWGHGSEWDSLSRVIASESGWNPRAENPTTTASGLFQMIDGTARAYGLGGHASNSSVRAQTAAGLRYIGNRYHDPNGAWGFHKAHGWYDQGGIADGPGLIAKGPKPERVLSPYQTELHDRQTAALEKIAAAGGRAQARMAPLAAGDLIVRENVDLARFERQQAFRERAANV